MWFSFLYRGGLGKIEKKSFFFVKFLVLGIRRRMRKNGGYFDVIRKGIEKEALTGVHSVCVCVLVGRG